MRRCLEEPEKLDDESYRARGPLLRAWDGVVIILLRSILANLIVNRLSFLSFPTRSHDYLSYPILSLPLIP